MKKIILVVGLALYSAYGFSQELTEEQKIDERIKALESKVEKIGQLSFSGYVQTQWLWDESKISTGDQNNFSVKRGRLKAAYANEYGDLVVQIDATEAGVSLKDAYLKAKIPTMKWFALQAGVFDRPFGYEISLSSSRRESPERSRVFQTLFPKERDMGAALIIKGPEDTFLRDFTLNAGLFSGNGGQAKETDSRKDFIGHLSYGKKYDDLSFGAGFSLYSGGVRLAGNSTQTVHKLKNGSFAEDSELEEGDYVKRRYFGFDGQVTFYSILGVTTLRGEYIWGTQPGALEGSKSPTGVITSTIYLRNFNGYYAYLVQDIANTKHSLVLKYDGYDPNTKLAGNRCETIGDISFSTFGFGWLFRANRNLRVICFYELTSNEKVINDKEFAYGGQYNKNLADNQFTLRLQYKF